MRSPDKAAKLRDAGCELVQGDLSDTAVDQARASRRADACIHAAAIYKVGIPKKDRQAMYESNVTGTENVLDAAIEAGTSRIVYVSTVNVFGNTKEQVVDETYERNESEGFLSCYDETKYRSHQIAKDRIAKGAPIVIVQPAASTAPATTPSSATSSTRRAPASCAPRRSRSSGSTSSTSTTSRTASCSRSTRARSASRTCSAARSRAWTT